MQVLHRFLSPLLHITVEPFYHFLHNIESLPGSDTDAYRWLCRCVMPLYALSSSLQMISRQWGNYETGRNFITVCPVRNDHRKIKKLLACVPPTEQVSNKL